MNIAQLLHNCSEQQILPHWPVLKLSQHKKLWYFYSVKGVTLRKKVENTSIVGFLNPSHQQDNDGNSSMMVLQAKQIDCRQPKQGQLYKIKVTKHNAEQIISATVKTDQQIILKNNWQTNQNQQITLYKIPNCQTHKLHTLQWLQNIITCKAPINSYHRDRLSQYAQLICKKAGQKFLGNVLYIKQFELVFTYDEKNAKLRIVFAHNFVLGCRVVLGEEQEQDREFGRIREMYNSDLRIGKDQHQCVEIFIDEIKNKQLKKPMLIQQNNKQNNGSQQNKIARQTKIEQPQLFSQRVEQNRIQYLKFLQKLHSQTALGANIKINIKKQQQPKPLVQQFQCSCCYSYVILSQFEHKKMISSNRIPQVQIVRQVKMKINLNSVGDYELVPVCSLCYDKFKQIVDQRDQNFRSKKQQNCLFKIQEKQFSMKNRVHSMKPRTLIRQLDVVKRQEQNKISTSSTTKQISKNPFLKPKFIKVDQEYTTKTNTTTIRQELNNPKQNERIEYYMSLKPRQRPRKSSLCVQGIDKINPTAATQIPKTQKTLIPQSQKHRSTYVGKNQENLTRKYQKCPSIDFETDDQLTNAVAEYEDMGISNKNKQKIKNLRNISKWRRRVF